MAVSDEAGSFAFPAGILSCRGPERDLEALVDVISERSIRTVVVGLPIHMDGRRGDAAKAAEEFANAIAERTGLRVEMLDERWTTQEAERALRDTDLRRGRRREAVDAAAATLLLRTWLQRESAGRDPA
jgi:putative Holliday junction resolvase